MLDYGIAGRVALVTGANNPHGIGAAIARALAAQGCALAIHYLRLPPERYGIAPEDARAAQEPGTAYYHGQRMRSGEGVAAAIRAAGGHAAAFEADLTDADAIPALLDRIEAALGPVTILINNAAHYGADDTTLTASPETWDATLAVNIRATALLTRAVAGRIQARNAGWGRVVNLSTDAAQCFATQVAYGASKAAIESYTRTAAIELAPLGITVNCIAPGPVQSGWLDAAAVAHQAAQIPLGRVGTPEDIAHAALFLCSRQAAWLTGNVLKVSGGHCI